MIKDCEPNDPVINGNFHFLKRLGTGGYGTVFVAHEVGRPRELVAVKVISAHLADDPPGGKSTERFAKEIAGIGRVKSPFVAAFLAADAVANRPWLATELVRGLALHELVRPDEGLPEAAVWSIGAGAVAALSAIWDADLRHRDLTPMNVLLEPHRPMVVDFGLVRLLGTPHITLSFREKVGNPRYIPPEQYQLPLAEVDDERSVAADVYMLGGTLLFAATGHAPHLLGQRTRDHTPDLTRVPRAMFDLIRSCLSYSPTPRPSADELRSEFAGHIASGAEFGRQLPERVQARLAAFERELAGLAMLCDGSCDKAGRGGFRESAAQVASDRYGVDAEPEDVTEPEGTPSPARRPGADARSSRVVRATGTRPLNGLPWEGDVRTAARPRIVAGLTRPTRYPSRRSRSSGSVRWVQQLGAWITSAVTLVADSAIVADIDGTVACLDAASGEVRWPDGPIGLESAVRYSAVPLPSADYGTAGGVCLGADDGNVYAVNVGSGRCDQLFKAGGAILGSPIVRGGQVYAVSGDGVLHVADIKTTEHSELYRAYRVTLGPPAAAGNLIVMGDSAGQVLAVSTVTGQPVWTAQTGGRLMAAPLAVDGTVFAAATDGVLRSMRTKDGSRRHEVRLGSAVHVTPAYSQGVLYVGTSDGIVRAFDLAQRGHAMMSERWAYPTDDEIGGLTVAAGRLYVSSGDSVHAFTDAGVCGPPFQMESAIAAAPTVSSGELLYLAGIGGMICCASMS